MPHQKIRYSLLQNFPFIPTKGQEYAITVLARFLISAVTNPLLILKGYAGTGKTSLVMALVKTIPLINMDFVLMAPTGRASKVLAHYSKKYALTIHKKIYAFEQGNDGFGRFSLGHNMHKNTVFIIDEASMIAGDYDHNTGSSLLDDVIKYVFNHRGCRLLFLGDTAQLPPVGTELSPALDLDFLNRNFLVTGAQIELTEVLRQEQDSGILFNATELRKKINTYSKGDVLFNLDGFSDITRLEGNELEDALESAYSQYGWEETIVLCRSNKNANIFNQQIRTRIKWQEDEISAGDYLMVVKNNYFWLPKKSKAGFIANGDTIEVLSLGKHYNKHDLHFVDATIRLVDYPEEPEYEIKLLLDTIMLNTPSLTSEENKALYYAVVEEYSAIKNKKERMKKVKEDPFFNALQVKFSYAVTCHKSQGGQWKAVFIEQGYLTDEMIDVSYLRWLYTALTRATEKVYLVNFNRAFFNSEKEEEW